MDLGNFSTGEVIASAVLGVICAFACLAIARAKGLPPAAFFVLGLFFNLIGVLITAVMPSRNAPGGTRNGPFGPPSPPAAPVPPREPQHEAGWYPDPWQEGHIRYYDGTRWTSDSQPGSTF